jgi:hypothetical protein
MIVLNSQDQGTIILSQQDYIPLAVESFLIDRKAQSVSPETLSFYRKKLKYFLSFCEAQAVTQISQLTPDLIRRFILHLAETHNQGGVHACFRPLRTLLTPRGELAVCDTLGALIEIGRHLRLFTGKADVGMALNIEGLDAMLEKVYGNRSDPDAGT